MIRWHLPRVRLNKVPNNFVWWKYVLTFLVSSGLYFLIMLFFISNDSVHSVFSIALCLGIAPIMMGLGCAGLLYSHYHSLKMENQFYAEFVKFKKQQWIDWTSQHICLVGYSYITAIDNVALKILGMDGDKPLNSNIVLPITSFQDLSQSKIQSALSQVMAPLIEEIKSKAPSLVIDIYSSQQSSLILDAFSKVCLHEKLHLSMEKQVNIINQLPNINILNTWIDSLNSERLVIILALHHEAQKNVTSEFVSAFLFSSPLYENKGFLINCYKVLDTEHSPLSDDFSVFINSGQNDKQNIRHFWNVNLSDAVSNTLLTEMIEHELSVNTDNMHYLNIHLGILNHLHGWLAIAIAGDAIFHGQKGQIIAQQVNENIYLLQMEKAKPIIKKEETKQQSYYPIWYFFSALLVLFSLCFLPKEMETKMMLFTYIAVGSFFFALFIFLSIPLKLKLLTKKYEMEWNKNEYEIK